MKFIILPVIFLSIFCICKAQEKIVFPKEYIDFKIDTSYFSINGLYIFMNTSDKTVNSTIIYPFDIQTEFIDSIRLIHIDNLKMFPYIKNKFSISFNLHLESKEMAEYNIFYRQPFTKKNTYILTTTKFWRKPLEEAVYCLEVDKHIKVCSLSLKPDSFISNSLNTIYYWHKVQFMPQNNFEVIVEKNY